MDFFKNAICVIVILALILLISILPSHITEDERFEYECEINDLLEENETLLGIIDNMAAEDETNLEDSYNLGYSEGYDNGYEDAYYELTGKEYVWPSPTP